MKHKNFFECLTVTMEVIVGAFMCMLIIALWILTVSGWVALMILTSTGTISQWWLFLLLLEPVLIAFQRTDFMEKWLDYSIFLVLKWF